MVPGVQDTVPGSRIISEGGPTAMSIDSAATADEADTIRNLKPPEMITEGSQFSLYEKRLRRWSRLSSLSPQLQFDLILSTVPISNPLCEKLEEEVGDSSEAQSKGVDVIIEKLKEWFGKQEDIDAFMHYKEFECKIRSPSQNIHSVFFIRNCIKCSDLAFLVFGGFEAHFFLFFFLIF